MRGYGRYLFGGGAILLALAIAWGYPAIQGVHAIATLSDPAKLATLRERGANPRLNKILYWLDQVRGRGLSVETSATIAQLWNRTGEPRAALVRSSLSRNLKIGDELGLFTPENRDHLRRGHAAIVTRGPYRGEPVEIDHIVPVSLAPEVGNELANLELLPETLNRRKSNRVGPRQLAHAEALRSAGLLTAESYARVQARSSRSLTE